MKRIHLLGPVLAAALLAACGGGGGSAEPEKSEKPPLASNTVPASALASAEAYSRYARSLPPSDTAEPVDLGTVTAPTSETAEPLAL